MGRMLKKAPGTKLLEIIMSGKPLNATSDLDFRERYLPAYMELSDEDRERLVAQQEEYLAKMRSIYMEPNLQPNEAIDQPPTVEYVNAQGELVTKPLIGPKGIPGPAGER